MFLVAEILLARPRKDRSFRKETQPLLSDIDLLRAVKKHSEVAQYDLTLEEIKAVFRAFYDITYQCLLNNIRVHLPFLGEFYSCRMKGFSGGTCTVIDKPFQKGSTTHKKYIEKKPDYSIMQFEFKKTLKDKFRNDTTDESCGE